MTKTLSQLTAPVRKRSMNIGDKLEQRQIASFIPDNFCENLCLCNRILLSQQVVQIQSDLIISRLVAATKFCCGDKDFHKHSPDHTKRFVATTCRRNVLLSRPTCTQGVIYRHDVLLQLVAQCVPTLSGSSMLSSEVSSLTNIQKCN